VCEPRSITIADALSANYQQNKIAILLEKRGHSEHSPSPYMTRGENVSLKSNEQRREKRTKRALGRGEKGLFHFEFPVDAAFWDFCWALQICRKQSNMAHV